MPHPKVKRMECQVAGCQCPLPHKIYHKRYRICNYHASLAQLVLNSETVRFCQQCGRFQPLSDFDGIKRSCRRKLMMHNAQRRGKRIGDRDEMHAKRSTPHNQPKSVLQPEQSILAEGPSTPLSAQVVDAESNNNNNEAQHDCDRTTGIFIETLPPSAADPSGDWINSIDFTDSHLDDDSIDAIEIDQLLEILEQEERGDSAGTPPALPPSLPTFYHQPGATVITGSNVLPTYTAAGITRHMPITSRPPRSAMRLPDGGSIIDGLQLQTNNASFTQVTMARNSAGMWHC